MHSATRGKAHYALLLQHEANSTKTWSAEAGKKGNLAKPANTEGHQKAAKDRFSEITSNDLKKTGLA